VSFRWSVIIWQPEVARIGTFSRNFSVFGKTTPYNKIFKILFGKFTSRHRSTLLCAKFMKIVRRKISEIVRCLPDHQKNFGSLSNCRYCADRARSLPWPAPTFGSQCSKFHPNRFIFGGVIAGRVEAVKTRPKANPILGEAIASRWVITECGFSTPLCALMYATTMHQRRPSVRPMCKGTGQ